MAEEVAENGDATNGNSKTVTFSAVKPQLFVEAPKANDAVQFYKAAFGAEEVNRVSQPRRKADQELPLVISAEIKLCGTTIIVSDLSDDSSAPVKSGTGNVFCLETEEIDAAVEKAVKAGAVKEGEVAEADGACCDGSVGKVKDPYGNVWMFCSPAAKKMYRFESNEQCLMEVFNVVYYGQAGLKPKDQVGTIKIIDEDGFAHCIYNVGKANYQMPSIKNKEQLILTGPTELSIPGGGRFFIDVRLAGGFYKDSIPFPDWSASCDYIYRERTIRSNDGTGEICVLFAQFAFALYARVKVEFDLWMLLDAGCEVDVCGAVAASTSLLEHPMFSSVLFFARESHRRKVAPWELPLSRSIVAVPMGSMLYIDIGLVINGVKACGFVEFHPEQIGEDCDYVRLHGGQGVVKVTVSWNNSRQCK